MDGRRDGTDENAGQNRNDPMDILLCGPRKPEQADWDAKTADHCCV